MQAPIQTSQPAATVDSRAAALRLAVVLDYTVVVEPAKVHAHTVGMAAAMVVKPAEAARLTVDVVQTVTAAPLVVSVVRGIAVMGHVKTTAEHSVGMGYVKTLVGKHVLTAERTAAHVIMMGIVSLTKEKQQQTARTVRIILSVVMISVSLGKMNKIVRRIVRGVLLGENPAQPPVIVVLD